MTIVTAPASTATKPMTRVLGFARDYAVLILLVVLVIVLSISSPSFLTFNNIVNIVAQNTPLAIVAVAGTFVIISGAFDLSTGAIFAVGSVTAAWLAAATGNPVLALLSAPLVGLLLGSLNGVAVTTPISSQ